MTDKQAKSYQLKLSSIERQVEELKAEVLANDNVSEDTERSLNGIIAFVRQASGDIKRDHKFGSR